MESMGINFNNKDLWHSSFLPQSWDILEIPSIEKIIFRNNNFSDRQIKLIFSKNTIFCNKKKHFYQILHHKLQKKLNDQFQSFKANNDWLSFSFAMVCNTWQWSYRFGGRASFSESDKFCQNQSFLTKKRKFLKIEPKSVILWI